MKSKFLNLFSLAVSSSVLLVFSSSAFAGRIPDTNIPEPGILPLLGLGGVVLAAAVIRNRRNKK